MMRDSTESFAEDVTLPADHWLCKMDGYLDWRVIGPQINNPYEIAFPDRVLDAMVKYRDVVRSHIKLRCLCDGHEVLRIDNLAMPILFTDHPCLVGTPRRIILGFVTYFGVEVEIERTIDRIQEEVREELSKRESVRIANKELKKSMGQIKAEKDAELIAEQQFRSRASGGGSRTGMQVRVIRR